MLSLLSSNFYSFDVTMLSVVFCLTVFMKVVSSRNAATANEFLLEFNSRGLIERNKLELASWTYVGNVSSKEAILSLKTASWKYNKFLEEASNNASKFIGLQDVSEDIQRQIKLIRLSWTQKDASKRQRLDDIKLKMQAIYRTTRVYDPQTKRNMSLSPGLMNILSTPPNGFESLKRAWIGWRDAVGPKILPLFEEYVALANQGRAQDNNFSDYGAFLRGLYEVKNLRELRKTLWKDVQPLYKELHAYVRNQLSYHYPHSKGNFAIPANLLGSMWAESWVGIYSVVKPYKDKPDINVTKSMSENNYTIQEMFRVTESFFQSLGFEKLPQKFLQRSMIKKPGGRDVECRASAWDMFLKIQGSEKDVRIHQCTEVTQDWLVTTHREMAHVYYFLSFWNQPFMYRDSANPGFYDAVGDMMSLFASSPGHLVKIGLLKDYVEDEDTEINALMKLALDSIAFLPFGYQMDRWRWGVFQSKIKPSQYNAEWWKLTSRYQGIESPIKLRDNDFDPGLKYLMADDKTYVRSFISTVLQFQFHKAACKAADFKGPLHQCSIYGSTAAGKKIRAMLQLGKRKPWPQALEILTNKRTMDAGPMKEYFWPLYLWLRKKRCSSKYSIGWPKNTGPNDDPCVEPTTLPDTEVGMTPPNTKATSKADAQYSRAAEKLTITVFAVLMCLNFQFNLVKSF